ncbi:MAG: hypothetical protein HWN65_08100 [Candidatus Helarchaeota archaeon]|nr:hypothetical protein [Candidatus Helarchaeota archaeon]
MPKEKPETEQTPPKSKEWPMCCKEDCTHDFQNKVDIPDSNELLNTFLIIIGILTTLYGIHYYFPDIVPWLAAIGSIEPTLIGILGTSMIILGGFALLAGIGMFQEQEWAWGMALMVLVFIIVNTIATVGGYLVGGVAWWSSWGAWLQIVSIIFAVIGIPWLLATKARYR